MKNLITILCLCLFWFSCESFGVFKHEHDQICILEYGGLDVSSDDDSNYYICSSVENESFCMSQGGTYFYGLSCEEFCDQLPLPSEELDGDGLECSDGK